MADDAPLPPDDDASSDVLSPDAGAEEEALETTLRPSRLEGFVGQPKIKENLRVFMTAALQRGDALDHTLLFGPPGLGKCITPDSLVLTGQGLVPFRELIPNDLKPGTSCPLEAEVFGTEGLEKTSHVYASGRTSTRRVTTRSGFVLEGTPQHPVRVATPQGPQWRRLDQLEAGDPVAIGRGTELWADDVHRTFWTPDAPADRRHRMEARVGRLHAALADALDRPPAAVELRSAYCAMQEITASPTPEQTAHRLGLPLADGNAVATVAQPWDRVASGFTRLNDGRRSLTLDADLAYLLGVLVGDGNWERGANAPAFTITCDEAAMQEELRRVSREAFGKAPAVQTCGDRTAKLRFSQNQGKACLRLGSEAAGAWEKEIPSAVLTSPRAVVVGFLQGLFDADGHAREDGVELGTRSEALARQVQLVLANLGIVAYRSTKERAGTLFQVLYVGGRDALRFYEEVGFRLERKYARREALRQKERGWSRCGLVPGANGPLAALLDKTTPHSRAVHKTFSHVKRGDRVPSRQQIKKYLDLLPDRVRREPEYETIQALTDPHVLWDAVAEVEEDEAETFDFVVPGTHSFVANGFYNHNTTLAHITAEEMGAKIVTTSGPVLEKPASLSGVLTNLEEGDVLFIDEIHRLASVVEEYLYSAMEDYRIDILIDSGPSSRTVQVKLKPFTLVGATTRKGLLTAPLRARFGIDLRFDYYPAEVLQEIVERSAGILSIEITDDGAFEVARRSRGTPRVANRLLRRTRDFAEVEGEGVITEDIADHALGALDVDEEGLDDMDTRILLTLIENFGGGPTGLNNLSVSVGENAGTIEEVYEPYLIQEGFMERTPRGRIALRRAYHHFDLTPPEEEDLFG